MSYEQSLSIAADGAAILTAIVAVVAYGRYLLAIRSKRRQLVRYLKNEREMRIDEGMRTITHLMANLGFTESEVLAAAFGSQDIRRCTDIDWDGKAGEILFQYEDESWTNPKRKGGKSIF